MTDDIFTLYDNELKNVVHRIELLKSSEKITLEEKIQIAELVLAILEEEKQRPPVQ